MTLPAARSPMLKDHPDHHDAELVIRLYELRREGVMRAARDAIYEQFTPKSYADLKEVHANRKHPLNAAYRQVGAYWEMVYGMAKHGIVHADFLLENNGEGFFLLAKVHPFLKELRAETSPAQFQNAEWAATHTEEGKTRFARIQGIVEKQRAAK